MFYGLFEELQVHFGSVLSKYELRIVRSLERTAVAAPVKIRHNLVVLLIRVVFVYLHKHQIKMELKHLFLLLVISI